MPVRLPPVIGVERPASGWGWVAALGVVAASTLLIYPLESVAPVVSLGVVYIPGVLLVSTFWGWRFGLLSAVASALAMTRWRKRLFLACSHVRADATDYFALPRDRTVIMGSLVEV